MIKAYSIDVLDDAMDQTRMVLRAHRQVPFNKQDDFDMVTADSILEMLNTFTRILRFGLVGISSISARRECSSIVVSNPMAKLEGMSKRIWTGRCGAKWGYEEISFVGGGYGHFGRSAVFH